MNFYAQFMFIFCVLSPQKQNRYLDVMSCLYKLLCRLINSYQKCPKTSLHVGHYRTKKQTLYDPDSLKFYSAGKAQVRHASRGVLAIWSSGSLSGGPADLWAEC